ncbi:hypothetical protein [Anaerolentibacter hominis]|uniref:hypothetical protein n=1 Tax=Anaerolentibacter hominis TaxID=3079009 RepID=UPI0031B855B6
MTNTNIASREVCDLIFEDFFTKKPVLNVDYANVVTTEVTGETVFAYGGKGHAKRIAFYGEKGGTISFECQIQPFKLYALLSGADIQNTASFLKREVLTAAEGKLTLTDTPAASDRVNVFPADDDCGAAVAVTVSGKEVTLPESSTGNFVAYYMVTKTSGVQRINLNANTFPKTFAAYASTVEKSEADELLPYKMVVYKCAPQTNFTLSFSNSGDPATLTFTADLLTDDQGNMLDMILLEAENGASAEA